MVFMTAISSESWAKQNLNENKVHKISKKIKRKNKRHTLHKSRPIVNKVEKVEAQIEKVPEEQEESIESTPLPFCGEYTTFQLPGNAKKEYQHILELENSAGKGDIQTYEVELHSFSGTLFEIDGFKSILGKKPPVNWSSTVQDCTTVLCALTTLFKSEESAQRALLVYYYSGYIISLDQSAHPYSPERIFALEEIREIDAALRMLPPHLYRLSVLKEFVTSDPKIGAAATALFATQYSPGRILFRGNTNYFVFTHEFGHHVDSMNNFSNGRYDDSLFYSNQDTFLNMNWQEGQQKFILENKLAAKGVKEAFAEMFKYYIMKPQFLRNHNPEGYNFFKTEIFKGKEYPDVDMSCPSISIYPKLPI
jgi:hypothetical protein